MFSFCMSERYDQFLKKISVAYKTGIQTFSKNNTLHVRDWF